MVGRIGLCRVDSKAGEGVAVGSELLGGRGEDGVCVEACAGGGCVTSGVAGTGRGGSIDFGGAGYAGNRRAPMYGGPSSSIGSAAMPVTRSNARAKMLSTTINKRTRYLAFIDSSLAWRSPLRLKAGPWQDFYILSTNINPGSFCHKRAKPRPHLQRACA